MAPIALENEDHSRDAAFNKALHGKSADSKGGFRSMLNKDRDAHKAASEEYFKHWDNKSADTETPEVREVSATLLRLSSSYSLIDHVGEKSRICYSHQALLQPCNGSLRIWLGRFLSLLQICIR